MANDTSSSRCQEQANVFKFGSTIRSEKSFSNDGFSITLDVRTLGYILPKREISDFCRSLVSILKRSLGNYETDLEFGGNQFEFSF